MEKFESIAVNGPIGTSSKADKPLSGKKSTEAHAEWVLKYEKIQTHAQSSLGRMTNDEKKVIDEGKIYRYAFNSTGVDSKPKAEALRSIGYKIAPGGFHPPYSDEVREQGEHLRKEIMKQTSQGSVRVQDRKAEQVSRRGIYYESIVHISGRGKHAHESIPVTVGWLDKRLPDGTTQGFSELTTLIPKGAGDKKGEDE